MITDGLFPLLVNDQKRADLLLNATVEAHAATRLRIEKTRPDCDQLAAMAQLHGEVLYLTKIGWLDAGFANKVQLALGRNTKALLGMTPEARQKLPFSQEPEAVTIAREDRQAPFVKVSSVTSWLPDTPGYDDYSPDPMGALFDCTPDVADIGVRTRAQWDAGNEAYTGLTPMGRWITDSEAYPTLVDKLLSLDRLASMRRYLFLSDIGQGTLAIGTGFVLIGTSLAYVPVALPALLVSGGVGMLGYGLNLASIDTNGGDGMGQQALAGLTEATGGPVRTSIVAVLFQQMMTMLREPEWYEFYSRGTAGATRARAAQTFLERTRMAREGSGTFASSAAKLIFAVPGLDAALASGTAAASFVGAAVFGSVLLSYTTLDYSQRFVPARQAYYLVENNADTINKFSDKQERILKAIKEQAKRLDPSNPNNHAHMTDIVHLKNELSAVKGDRELIIEDARDLEPACDEVSQLVVELIDVKRRIRDRESLINDSLRRAGMSWQQLAVDAAPADGRLAANAMYRHVRYTSSVVDAVFNKLERMHIQ